MTKIPKLKPILLLITCFLLLFASARAAELNLISQTKEINVGQQFQVDVILNAEGESINAVEGKIVFPADILELKEIRDGNSIVNFWVDPVRNCVSNGVEQPDSICFSGIIPGGYQDTKGFLFSVIFQAKTIGSSAIEIHDAKVLLNDGKGTGAETKIFNFQFSIFKEAPISQTPISQTPILEIKDTDPPEDFKPEIARDSAIFEGKWFLVFATQDKGLGIDHYEAQESRSKKVQDNSWTIAQSPFLLEDQELKSFIYVKAIDKAGNEKIEMFLPKYPPRWYGQPLIWSIIILGIIIAYLMRFKIKNAKRKSAI